MDVYQFSIDRDSLPQRPFTTGALYILPRESFRQIPLWPGGPLSNEWASPTKVRPLARFTIEPEDFPFLDRIGGHDDGPLLRMLELTRALFDRATSARRIDDGFAIDLPWSDETAGLYDEWHGLFEQMMPGVDVGLSGTGDRRGWTLQGPEAFRSTAAEWLGDLLSD